MGPGKLDVMMLGAEGSLEKALVVAAVASERQGAAAFFRERPLTEASALLAENCFILRVVA